ncbi:hypothetical protein M3Y94_00025400 [Aphelenchoides besseyi]|nr:hypothetical protein M3Y94_00025400 [Aphelenchoides besseyi]KAI6217233.1 hypothetical protein M3Y95_01228800 [Aphelenchoides besseyi]
MFRVLFVGLTLFGAFASVVSYGNNQCITKYERSETDWHKRGFNFTGCQDAEILIKWDKNFKLFFTFGTETSMCIKFKIIVNDGCELNFEGKNEIGDWKWETGETNIRCDKSWCSTHITKNGAIPSSSYYGMSECARNDLRNPIDDEWVWTKIRVKVAEISGQVPILVNLMSAKAKSIFHQPPRQLWSRASKLLLQMFQRLQLPLLSHPVNIHGSSLVAL